MIVDLLIIDNYQERFMIVINHYLNRLGLLNVNNTDLIIDIINCYFIVIMKHVSHFCCFLMLITGHYLIKVGRSLD